MALAAPLALAAEKSGFTNCSHLVAISAVQGRQSSAGTVLYLAAGSSWDMSNTTALKTLNSGLTTSTWYAQSNTLVSSVSRGFCLSK